MSNRKWNFLLACCDPLAVIIVLTVLTLVFTLLPFAHDLTGGVAVAAFCVIIVGLVTPAIVLQVRRAFRRLSAKVPLTALLLEGRAILAGMARGVSQEADQKARDWSTNVQTVLRKYLDESYIHRFETPSFEAGVPSEGTMRAGELHSRVINLAGILRELSA